MKDRILVESTIRCLNTTKDIIEVIDVGGKLNLAFYKKYLDAIHVPNFTIADFDYLRELKSAELGPLFVTNHKKIDEIIKNKKSDDRLTLIEAIEDFVAGDNKQKLSEVIDYLKSRGISLKPTLNTQEQHKLDASIAQLKSQQIFIICTGPLSNREKYTGEIEDFILHVPKGENSSKSIDNLASYISKKDFLKDMAAKNEREIMEELLTFVCIIVFDDTATDPQVYSSLLT